MDAFEEGTELIRVYIASSVREATAIEAVLDGADVEFAVEVEQVASSDVLGLRATRRAAGFWIREGELDRAYGALERAGHVGGLVRR